MNATVASNRAYVYLRESHSRESHFRLPVLAVSPSVRPPRAPTRTRELARAPAHLEKSPKLFRLFHDLSFLYVELILFGFGQSFEASNFLLFRPMKKVGEKHFPLFPDVILREKRKIVG